MAIDVEQFTAPGKYAIDLKMEEIDKLLRKNEDISNYQKETNQTDTKKIKYNRTQNK